MTKSIRLTRKSSKNGKNKSKSINTRWRITFIETLARLSNVAASAREAKIELGTAYRARREKPRFAAQWQKALCEGYDHLEIEVLRRLREGAYATAGGGKYDFASALRSWAAHRESAVMTRAQRRHTSVTEIRASPKASSQH